MSLRRISIAAVAVFTLLSVGQAHAQVSATIFPVTTYVNNISGETSYLAGDNLKTENKTVVSTGPMDANDTYWIEHEWFDADGTIKTLSSATKTAGLGTSATWNAYATTHRVPTSAPSSTYGTSITVKGTTNGTIAVDSTSAVYNWGG